MSMSGAKLGDDVKQIVHEMRTEKKDDTHKKIAVLHVPGDIKVEKSFTVADVAVSEEGNAFKFLANLMKQGECRFIVYDCNFKTDLTEKDELVFIFWSCDEAKAKQKMPYAAAKKNLSAALSIKHNFEFHSQADIKPEEFAEALEKMVKTDIISLEGIPLQQQKGKSGKYC